MISNAGGATVTLSLDVKTEAGGASHNVGAAGVVSESTPGKVEVGAAGVTINNGAFKVTLEDKAMDALVHSPSSLQCPPGGTVTIVASTHQRGRQAAALGPCSATPSRSPAARSRFPHPAEPCRTRASRCSGSSLNVRCDRQRHSHAGRRQHRPVPGGRPGATGAGVGGADAATRQW